MRERPILFNGAMVRAILAGRKTQTRRVVKPQPDLVTDEGVAARFTPRDMALGRLGEVIPCSFGQPGDRLWVRETWGYRGSCWSTESPDEKAVDIHYQADDGRASYNRAVDDHSGLPKQRAPRPDEDYIEDYYNGYLDRYWKQWRPSIHMPRWACRLVLEITNVRVERLEAISGHDCSAEGACPPIGEPLVYGSVTEAWARREFAALWESTGGDWDSNPWVWVIEFKRVEVGHG